MSMDVYNLGGPLVNGWVIETPAGLIAVDTGYPGDFNKYCKRFLKKWSFSDLKYIFLTHHHNDHTGFAKRLSDMSGAVVIAHENAKNRLEKGDASLDSDVIYTTYFSYLFSKFTESDTFEPLNTDKMIYAADRKTSVSDNTDFFKKAGLPFDIVLLYGHTFDSIGLYCENEKILFCGDACMNTPIGRKRHSIIVKDIDEYLSSWDKMISLDVDIIYPGHGKPFCVGDLVTNKDALSRFKMYTADGVLYQK